MEINQFWPNSLDSKWNSLERESCQTKDSLVSNELIKWHGWQHPWFRSMTVLSSAVSLPSTSGSHSTSLHSQIPSTGSSCLYSPATTALTWASRDACLPFFQIQKSRDLALPLHCHLKGNYQYLKTWHKVKFCFQKEFLSNSSIFSTANWIHSQEVRGKIWLWAQKIVLSGKTHTYLGNTMNIPQNQALQQERVGYTLLNSFTWIIPGLSMWLFVSIRQTSFDLSWILFTTDCNRGDVIM